LAVLMAMSVVGGTAVAADRWEYGRLSTNHRVQQATDSITWTAGHDRLAAEDVAKDVAKFFKDVTGKEWVNDEVKDPGVALSVVMNALGDQGWELVGFQLDASRTMYVFKRRLAEK